MLVSVYTCKKATMLEITCHSSYCDNFLFQNGDYAADSSLFPHSLQKIRISNDMSSLPYCLLNFKTNYFK